MRGRWPIGLFVAWAVTRALLGVITAHGEFGPYDDRTSATTDVELYEFRATQTHSGLRPYVDFDLEYPPANLPFILTPHSTSIITGTSYETHFILLCVALDGLTMMGLVRLCRASGRWAGPIGWLLVVPALGPVALARLDLIPAAALVWAVVLARERRWPSSAVALGTAAGTKIFAGLLIPLWAIWVPPSRRLAAGVALAASLAIPLMVAGISADIHLASGAWEIFAQNTSIVKTAATLSVIAVAVHALTVSWRWRTRPFDLTRVATLSASTVVLSVALGNILSPQYLIWCGAATAAAAAAGAHIIRPLALVILAAAASHLIYPIYFFDIVSCSSSRSN